MQYDYPFSERFDFLEIKLNTILDNLHALSMQMVEQKKPFLSLQEATKYLNVSKHTIYGWTSKNKLPFYDKQKPLISEYYLKSLVDEEPQS